MESNYHNENNNNLQIDSPNRSDIFAEITPGNNNEDSRNEFANTNVVRNSDNLRKWYVLRTTYGQERKAYEYIISHGGEAFCPTLKTTRRVNGVEKLITVSRFPNLFFMRGTYEEVRSFAEEDPMLPYLRFYSRRSFSNHRFVYTPIVVPDSQMQSLQLLCEIVDENILVVPPEVTKFESGQKVRIIAGEFQGIEGRVARWHGQQRVAVIIPDLLTMATAYIPSNFLKAITT